jgi:hypothetical protein
LVARDGDRQIEAGSHPLQSRAFEAKNRRWSIRALLGLLWEGIDWRRSTRTEPPARVGLLSFGINALIWLRGRCRVTSLAPDADIFPEDPAVLQAMILGLRAEIAGMTAANRA